MNSILLKSTAKFLLPGMLLFSFFLLLRGHNLPGGGFSGGLVAASAFALYGLAFGRDGVQKILQVHPVVLIGYGVMAAVLSGILSVLGGQIFLEALWFELLMDNGESFKVGTPLIFDVGVYLVVIGGVMAIILALQEE